MGPRLLALVALSLALALASPPAHARGATRQAPVARKASTRAKERRATRPPKPRKQPSLSRIQKLVNPFKKLSGKRKAFIEKFRERRLSWIRSRGEIFRRITQRGDFRRDYVLVHNKKVTAFLDWSDPHHPQYDPGRKTGEQHLLDPIPESRRAHVLVVPSQPREHIARKLGDQIGLEDLDAARATMKEAHAIAKKLGIKSPRIWINSPSRISVGYLHVHIIGERTKSYPPALAGKVQDP